MQARASFKYARISPRKLNRFVRVARRVISYPKAKAYLSLMPNKGAKIVLKALENAYNNLKYLALEKQGYEPEEDKVLIKNIWVTKGRDLRRVRPRARGRADIIRRRTSHLFVILEDKEGADALLTKGPEKKEFLEKLKKERKEEYFNHLKRRK